MLLQRPENEIRDFTHPELNAEITAIGGHFVWVKEALLSQGSAQILYYVGCAVVDTSCCGPGGAAFASVAGYVRQWHFKMTAEGRPVSRIEPILNLTIQNKIRRIISAKEFVPQINFGWS